ncbi:acylneuraminate cytidylyltransferase family protein [archaeon]|jgi:CMP-N,N'-diacetyllegionaminic acid synthase|nr:acylneuraminate cytidylyltransferase family protein [archaeon]MBT4352349.1 acylneuraminate cytidylyltransferase family protein [archaeon]MBT6820965.1 acylneuraminate cytidylyltransferase family protein [archaeon]MBT7392157.1 acylneuraminate cytidylyltransferase family protein [archaeon]
MKIISIIPARGGSKGIPGKNIKEFAGKPLIAHTIEQSLNSELINRTIVSTDSQAIKDVSLKFGAEVINRPNELAQDTTPTEPAIEHVISYLKEKENYVPDMIVLLQCTSPLRNKDDIDNQIKMMINKGSDSCLSVSENIHFIWKIKKDSAQSFNYDFKNRPRRQDREKEFKENGSIYVFKTDGFLKEKNRLFGKIGIYEMPYDTSFEIDEPFDFWLCEQIYFKLFK